MIRHRPAALLAGAALLIPLTACSAPALDAGVAAQLQDSVTAVAGAAAAGDLAAAATRLDELQAEFDTAVEADQVTAARAARIQSAITAVRADLVAATPSPSTSPSGEPADDDADDGDKGQGGGNGNDGPGKSGRSGNSGNGSEKKDD